MRVFVNMRRMHNLAGIFSISIIHTVTLFSKHLILALRILSNIISELTRASALFIFNLYHVSVTLFQQ